MNGLAQYVDVLWGCGGIDLSEPQAVAAVWKFIKGHVGNTSPAAMLPFSRISAGTYAGGYFSGYGRAGANSGMEEIKVAVIMETSTICGVFHMHGSGTGPICTYSDYAVSMPYYGENVEAGVQGDMMQGGKLLSEMKEDA